MNKKILVIGAGPILVGQACEFDYSGSQSCKTLKEENFKVILLNSNPATIMTDYEIADTIYIEKINKNNLIKIVQIEKPDFILPTMGGQTALNCIFDFINSKYNFSEKKILGINKKILINAESRLVFSKLIGNLNLKCPDSIIIKSTSDIKKIDNVSYPCIIRPSFTLGGLGSGIAYNKNSLYFILKNAFLFSNEVSLDKSIIGWKEYELELLIDNYNNIIVICCIENIDPVGIHTGDSITITPAQTISDKEYQNMRDSSFIILKSVGLKGGGANIQFAINPINGDLIVIEMNPRISRSAALSSKATGYSIAKISTKLSIGYSLLKLFNNSKFINLPSGYEPCIDYIAIKIPKFNFEKYLELNFLNTIMKSIGEVLGIGFSFQEAFLKAIYSIFEINIIPSLIKNKFYNSYKNKLIKKIINPNSTRIFYILDLFRLNTNIKIIFCLSKIDPWFLFNIKNIIENEKFYFHINNKKFYYKKIDSCSNEFEKNSLYYYSSKNLYFNELRYSIKKKIIIIGSGSNRIGQSIEFDYCCTKFSKLIKKIGIISTIINCNPETVSTDYDISNYLFFEPITNVYINNIINIIKPILIICQIGGQSPINYLFNNKKINKIFFGFNKNSILFGKKKFFNKLLFILKLNKIKNYNCINIKDLIFYFNIFNKTIITRLPNIIGGSLMKIIYNNKEFLNFINLNKLINIYIEEFLFNSKELDIDILIENGKIILLNIIEHIENTGIHSGDSNMIFPNYSLSVKIIKKIFFIISIFCFKLNLNGIINFQICFKKKIYIIECNPRASRTIPFSSKSNKYPIIYNYVLILLGYNVCFINKKSNFYFIKSSIFPFNKFKISKLSPEMKSTGEEMNSGLSIQECFYKLFLLTNKIIFFNTKNIYIYIKYLKKINFLLKTNSFNKNINFDLHINSYVSKKKKDKYIISDKINVFNNKTSFSSKSIIIFFFSSFDKEFLLVRKLNKI
ncbi:carbamoyl phosphate synthase large subunit [Candidatus Carsonella ruddii]|uniref:Carbamoylphosphate synthase large subunit n=1 Tax=Candidatus Carsonella ruddii PC isolate NHV TaxID=1202540 RepID=J3Z209_CARRU|nr:carbamoyl phosphate synthase large subunit [Candidatus Carsonella ruddii]AFP84294.1 carbamoylphosphate synthase large subunit [Candidatus Carsonella ruddii PC isolate NHV]